MNSYTLEKVSILPDSVQDYIEQDGYSTRDGFQARFISNTKLAYVVCGAHIDIVDTRIGRKISEWTFGAILKDTSTKIVCVKELTAAFKEVTLLAIGLECMITGGMVCILDIQSSKVLRAIQIKDKVTSLHVISNGDELTSFPGPLNNFDGALAVGTAGGDVLIVDMCRQAIDEARLPAGFLDIKNEVDPCQLMVLSINDVDRIERHKEVADRNGNHLAVHINAIIGDNSPHFTLKGPKGDDRVQVNKPEVCVSALMYAPQLCSIFIGYNFGALQIWNLVNMRLIFTSAVYQENIPVSHFALQEPADDPRAFCYFWAVYSSTEPYCKSFPIAILYSLAYESKDWHEGYGYIYQNMQTCSIRFQADLSVMDSKDCSDVPIGAQCLRLHAFSKGLSKDCSNTSLQEGNEDSYTLCLMVWNVWCRNRDSYTFLSVFDLNQWYKEQMPNTAQSDQYKKYMANVRLSDLTNSHMESNKYPLFDAHIDAATVSQFIGAQRLEEHYYPTALAFDCWAINEFEIYQLYNRGYQRQFCQDIEQCGPLALMKPSESYETAIRLGLTPIFVEATRINLTNLLQQREFLLSVALENRMKNWLCKCATSWGNGSHRSAGLSLDLLLNWAWQRASFLKSCADNLCVPLFDYYGEKLDTNASRLLSKCRSQILILRNLYTYIYNKCTPFLIHPEITRQQWECLKRIFTYLDIQSWMINVGLLPESSQSNYSGDKLTIPYPDSELRKYYNDRRSNLHILNQTKQLMKGTGFLYIDKLIDGCADGELEKEWQKVGGIGQYPPPSLQALLRTYLLENVDIEQKHMILTYFFLDLAMILDQDKYKAVIPTLIKFPTIFQLPTCTIKMVQAFWHLDHNELETGIEQLIDPMIKRNMLANWHHKFVLRSLMLQDHHKLAHLYLKTCQPPINDLEDVILSITLYVSNNMVHDAFNLSRQHRGKGDGRLTRLIFQECLKTNQIDKLITCKMTRAEEEALFRFMEDIKYFDRERFRSVYYLQKGRYFDFYNLTSKQNSTKHLVDEDFGEINSVVDTLVPNITKKIIGHCLQRKDGFRNEIQPKPMSVFLHNQTERMKYDGNFMEAMLCKAKETWCSDNNDGMRKWLPKMITGEDFPFIKTPTSFPPNYSVDKDIIYAKTVKTFSSQVEEADEVDFPQPRKRIKLSPRNSTIDSSIAHRAEESKIFELTKIDTPIIKRNSSVMNATVCQTLDFISTPQSILKVRSFRQNSVDMDRGNMTTPDNLDELEIESNISLDFSKQTDCLMDTTEKLNVTGRKSLVRTPVVRFSGVRMSDSSTASSSINQSLIANDSMHSNLNIEPLPHSIDTSVAYKAPIDSKNSSTDTFYSPENTVAEECGAIKESFQLNVEEATKLRSPIPGSPSSRRSYKHTDIIDVSHRQTVNNEIKKRKMDLETARREEIVGSVIEKFGGKEVTNTPSSIPKLHQSQTTDRVNRKLRIDQDEKYVPDSSKDEETEALINVEEYMFERKLDIPDDAYYPSPPISCSKILEIPKRVKIKRRQVPKDDAKSQSPAVSVSKILEVYQFPKPKRSEFIKETGFKIDETADVDVSGVDQLPDITDFQNDSINSISDSPKCRKSYKGKFVYIYTPEEQRSSPRLKKSESPQPEETTPNVHRPGCRKSLTRKVLENNTRTKLLSSGQLDVPSSVEKTVTKTESVKKVIGNITEVIGDKDESRNVIEESEECGKQNVAEMFREEFSKGVKRILEEVTVGGSGDAFPTKVGDDEMEVDGDVFIGGNNKVVDESDIEIQAEEIQKEPENMQQLQEEEEANIYEDLESYDLGYHEGTTFDAFQNESLHLAKDAETTVKVDPSSNINRIEISDDDSDESEHKDQIITLDSSSSTSKFSEMFEPNLQEGNNGSVMSFNDSETEEPENDGNANHSEKQPESVEKGANTPSENSQKIVTEEGMDVDEVGDEAIILIKETTGIKNDGDDSVFEEKNASEPYVPARRTRSSSMKNVEVAPALPTRRTKRAVSTDCAISRSSLRVKMPADEKEPSVATPKKKKSRTKSIDAISEEQPATPSKPRTRRSSSILMPIEEESKSNLRSRKKSVEYSTSRRLTRKQKELMEKNMPDNEDNDSSDNDDMRTMDRIHLMDKNNFEGEIDPDEEKLLQRSPVSTITGSSLSENVARDKRAPSEVSDLIIDDSPKGRKRRDVTESPIRTPVRRGRSQSLEVADMINPATTPTRRTRKTSQSSIISNASTETRRSTRSTTKSDVNADVKPNTRKRVTAKAELEQINEESNDTASGPSIPRTRGRPRKLN